MNSSLQKLSSFCEACPLVTDHPDGELINQSIVQRGIALRALHAIDRAALQAHDSEGTWTELSPSELQAVAERTVDDVALAEAAARCYQQMQQTGCQAYQKPQYIAQHEMRDVAVNGYL